MPHLNPFSLAWNRSNPTSSPNVLKRIPLP